MISERRKNFPSSGEINFSVTDADSCLDRIKDVYSDTSNYIDNTDEFLFLLITGVLIFADQILNLLFALILRRGVTDTF